MCIAHLIALNAEVFSDDSCASPVWLHRAVMVVPRLTAWSRNAEIDDDAIASPLYVVVQQVWYNDHRHTICTMMEQTLVSTGQGAESRTLSRKDEAMADRVGQQLGNYRILRPIGHGGFADVYLGEHLYLQTQVALKLLYMRLAEEDMEGFLKEARTIAHVVHPHIVRVLDFGIEGRMPFLVMDYAPGGTLRQHHAKGTTLPLPTITSYVKQVADALQYAHEKKLIHRDIKPENMLLAENQQVLLSDFGIALITQSTRYQHTQEVVGTAAYMAPEQLQGKPRRASDQYSLGIVVYEWLCGDRPFHGTFTELYSQHLFVPPPSLCEKLPELAPAIEKVVLTALAKDPKERFASIQAFATAWEQACQGVPSPPVTLPFESARQSQPLPPTHVVAATSPVQSSPSPVAPTPSSAVFPLSMRDSLSPGGLQPSRQPISRRAVVIGLAGLAGAGGLTWLVFSRKLLSPSLLAPTPPPLGTLLYTYRGHSNWVWAVAWSPDGQRIASASEDHMVQVWDGADGNHGYTYGGHSAAVYTVAWSPDGQRIASGGYDHTVQVWDAADGNHGYTYRGHPAEVYAVAWSPDGRRIASRAMMGRCRSGMQQMVATSTPIAGILML